ncbi:tetratricopeptide repeat protein 5-like [Phymastichus coffea]|uniref:tetratricopeptide repeat protein 5-like n=1 Tax=Phymastichus coffea TaxID=108790 RepID=UPI00273BEE32|nr:tetratricopeptide repeat protein 5-like [Phymastichus coffea]XP_058789322.1 tetratricopeptide repeat protein 5-like [Phymastichus coffea]XP_058789323.1 tetratricopeptide repeat protein 5-like [Phymastichus coffea]XP_058789324.1 tetratricopeptide repeat protein 5-like [Phymastichus coffea]
MSTIIDDKIVAGAQDPNVVKEDPIVILTEKVKSLYFFRDHYFENHSIENAINKHIDVENEMKNTLAKFDECKGYEIDGARAKYYYLKGKTFNVVDKFTPQAEELLSKAVKLEPKLIEAWNELGECYWKNDDIQQAKNCFVGALPHGKNKVSLRNLSMVLRQEVASTKEQKIKNIQQGVEYAREAVSLDPSDGISWSILGNAYLSSFFTIAQNPSILRLCMSAYLQAEKDVIAKSNPDLHHNKAMTLKYQEEYKLALESFHQASLLDPTWDTPRDKQNELLKYLNNVQTSINTKGSIKPKKLFQMIQSLNQKHLGPYKGGSYTSGDKCVKLELVHLNDLVPGINLEKVVFGKVVCWIQDSDSVPFAFCMVDEDKTCMAVTLYNLAKGKGVTVGDSVAIPEPFLTKHNFSYLDNNFEFKSIRVETPVVLIVNGRKLGLDQQANVKMSTFKKSN